jgi:nucleoside-diphosphate-sugar epimerase
MTDDGRLELELSEPTESTIAAMAGLDGDLLVLGAGGKMGPSLCRLAVRSARAAGSDTRVVAVARFSDPVVASDLVASGVETIRADLLDREALEALPDLPNVVFMAGQKFGTSDAPFRTWALNGYLPGLVADRFRRARIVVFSSGNVYPLWPVASDGPGELDPVGPVGEYAQSVLARERLFEYGANRYGTRTAILRLNYAVEPRYGVLRDIAERVRGSEPVSLGMGWVNLIWQRDANGVALQAFAHCASPPFVLNVAGAPAASVREVAERFGTRFGAAPRYSDHESDTALLTNPARCHGLMGVPPVGIDAMIDAVARWIEAGGRSLGRPTHFEQRDGRF